MPVVHDPLGAERLVRDLHVRQLRAHVDVAPRDALAPLGLLHVDGALLAAALARLVLWGDLPPVRGAVSGARAVAKHRLPVHVLFDVVRV